jgi:hypothetical protein
MARKRLTPARQIKLDLELDADSDAQYPPRPLKALPMLFLDHPTDGSSSPRIVILCSSEYLYLRSAEISKMHTDRYSKRQRQRQRQK